MPPPTLVQAWYIVGICDGRTNKKVDVSIRTTVIPLFTGIVFRADHVVFSLRYMVTEMSCGRVRADAIDYFPDG